MLPEELLEPKVKIVITAKFNLFMRNVIFCWLFSLAPGIYTYIELELVEGQNKIDKTHKQVPVGTLGMTESIYKSFIIFIFFSISKNAIMIIFNLEH